MDGLTQSYLSKERLLKCESIDLGRFVVDLRERHLDYWTPFSDIDPQERTGKRSTSSKLPSMVRPPYQEGPGHTFAIHFS